MMISRKPILVTGSHRSGTTWVGKMLALSPSVGYIQEPFNPLDHRPGICSVKWDHWFYYVTPENEAIFYEKIKDSVSFSYNLKEEFKMIKSAKDALRMLKDYINFEQYRISRARPLLKDPIALFSAEWLASKFNMDVVVMIRHPAAFAGSIKSKNWLMSFSEFLEQPLLMQEHLYPFETEMKEYEKREPDVIDQAILLWKIMHHTIIKYQKKYKEWIFVRHEDISREPILGFQTLFKNLDIEFSGSIKEEIKKYSSFKKSSEEAKNRLPFSLDRNLDLKRDSRTNIDNWKSRLTASEIERIRSGVESISSVFYSDADWG
jgi:hypothetical protein